MTVAVEPVVVTKEDEKVANALTKAVDSNNGKSSKKIYWVRHSNAAENLQALNAINGTEYTPDQFNEPFLETSFETPTLAASAMTTRKHTTSSKSKEKLTESSSASERNETHDPAKVRRKSQKMERVSRMVRKTNSFNSFSRTLLSRIPSSRSLKKGNQKQQKGRAQQKAKDINIPKEICGIYRCDSNSSNSSSGSRKSDNNSSYTKSLINQVVDEKLLREEKKALLLCHGMDVFGEESTRRDDDDVIITPASNQNETPSSKEVISPSPAVTVEPLNDSPENSGTTVSNNSNRRNVLRSRSAMESREAQGQITAQQEKKALFLVHGMNVYEEDPGLALGTDTSILSLSPNQNETHFSMEDHPDIDSEDEEVTPSSKSQGAAREQLIRHLKQAKEEEACLHKIYKTSHAPVGNTEPLNNRRKLLNFSNRREKIERSISSLDARELTRIKHRIRKKQPKTDANQGSVTWLRKKR